MTRAQWLFVLATGLLAAVAYVRADTVWRRINSGQYRAPSSWTA